MKFVTRKLSILLLALSFHFLFVACSGDQQQMDEEVTQEGGQQNETAGNQQSDQQYADQNGNQEDDVNNIEEGDLDGNQLAQQGEEENDQGEDYAEEDGEDEDDLQAILNEVNNEGMAGQGDEVVEDLTNQQAGGENFAQTNVNATEDVADFAAQNAPMNNNSSRSNSFNSQQAAPMVAGSLPEDGTVMPYVVVKGDTLGSISQKIFGNSSKWREIANNSNLADPNRIFAGDVVYYPLNAESKAFAERYENAPMQVVQVQPGDSLHKIAQSVYGNSSAWVFLWRHNGSIDNPDRLEVGSSVYYVPMDAMTAAVKSVKSDSFAGVNAKLAKKSA